MPRYQDVRFALLFALVGSLVCQLPARALASTVDFTQIKAPGQSAGLHADLNTDGREDFVYLNLNDRGFEVVLSTGDGAYAAPTVYELPGGRQVTSVGIADVNGDGQADILAFGYGDSDFVYLFLFLNDGKGHFSEKAAFFLAEEVDQFVIADFNHDGIMDIAFLNAADEDGPIRDSENAADEDVPIRDVADANGIQVWFGDGHSGFTVGPVTPTGAVGQLVLGDFDGDGKADLAVEEADPDYPNDVSVFYGDGTGYFPVQRTIHLSANYSARYMDIDGDGTTDIEVSSFPSHHFNVYYGNSNRTWSKNAAEISILHCYASPVVADVNGDGMQDLVVLEANCSGGEPGFRYVGVLTRNSNGTYDADKIIYTAPSSLQLVSGPAILRANLDAKPDISIGLCSATTCARSSNIRITLLNATSGDFPTCEAPNAFEGIHVCSPTPNSTITWPVSFRVGAAGQVPMRKVEVWVDGKKQGEQLGGFSSYTFMDQSLDLFYGSHRIVIFAVGWDNSIQEKIFTLIVK
jgi:hypothetical protein